MYYAVSEITLTEMGNILSYFFPPSQPSIEQVLEEAQVEEVKEENIPESPKVSVENENNVSDSVVDDSIPVSCSFFQNYSITGHEENILWLVFSSRLMLSSFLFIG